MTNKCQRRSRRRLWARRQQQQQRWCRLCLVATTSWWRQWRQQGWNGDRKTAATGKAEAVALFGSSGDKMRLERQLPNGGDGQGGRNNEDSGAGFAWRQRRCGGNSGSSESGMATENRQQRARRRQQKRRRRRLHLAAA